MIWIRLFPLLAQLRSVFPRQKTFFVFVTTVVGMLVRPDLRGVTSFVRALSLKPAFYRSFLRLFRCAGIDVGTLSDAWTKVVFSAFDKAIFQVDGRPIIVADGLKVPKEGRRMPAVKSLHQESSNNSKPEWIMGHMFQSIAVIVEGIGRLFAVPLSSRIHEGLRVSNLEQKTLIDKLSLEVLWLPIPKPFILVADAYYCAGDLAKLLFEQGCHLISVARSNAVAFRSPSEEKKKRRGRKRKYGEKVKLKDFYGVNMKSAVVRAYGNEKIEVQFATEDLLWKSSGKIVRFVVTLFPGGKRAILVSTDTTLAPETIIEIYATRIRIEQSFKVQVRCLGAYAYHFWTKAMKKIPRRSKGQHIHKEPEWVRRKMFETLQACEIYVVCGIVAQGLLQYLSIFFAPEVSKQSLSWFRSQVVGASPTEEIVKAALRHALPQFPRACASLPGYAKFIASKSAPVEVSAFCEGDLSTA